MLTLPRHSKLALTPPATLAELKDEPCFWFACENASSDYDFWIGRYRRAQFVPRQVEMVADTSTILGFVAAGMGCSIVPDVSGYSSPVDVRPISYPDLSSTYGVESVWSADAINLAFVQYIQHSRP
jgi:DNA-binding transcriptional LysR family regulator